VGKGSRRRRDDGGRHLSLEDSEADCAAGGRQNSVGPDASELTPDQIKAKIEADTVLWNAKIEALRNINLQVLEIVKRKDAKELSEAGEILDQACESCHLEYWYPAEKDLMKRLDRRLKGQ